MANAFYFLAKNPPVLRKLQGYLDELCPNGGRDWSYAKTTKFPYLDHVINETLRLKPPVPSGLPRITPPEGIQIDEVYIPGDTIVAVPTHTIQRDERYYGRSLDFYPERWEKISPEKSAFMPFTRGMYLSPILYFYIIIPDVYLQARLHAPARTSRSWNCAWSCPGSRWSTMSASHRGRTG